MKFTRSVLSQQKEIPSSCILSSARLCQQKRQSAWWRCRSWGRPQGPFCCCSSWLGSRRASCWDPVDWCCWWWNILTGISCQYYSWPPSQTDNTSSLLQSFTRLSIHYNLDVGIPALQLWSRNKNYNFLSKFRDRLLSLRESSCSDSEYSATLQPSLISYHTTITEHSLILINSILAIFKSL